MFKKKLENCRKNRFLPTLKKNYNFPKIPKSFLTITLLWIKISNFLFEDTKSFISQPKHYFSGCFINIRNREQFDFLRVLIKKKKLKTTKMFFIVNSTFHTISNFLNYYTKGFFSRQKMLFARSAQNDKTWFGSKNLAISTFFVN